MTIFAKYLCRGDKINGKIIKRVSTGFYDERKITVVFRDSSEIVYDAHDVVDVINSETLPKSLINVRKKWGDTYTKENGTQVYREEPSRKTFEEILRREFLLQRLAENVEVIKTDRLNQIESATITLNRETLDFFLDYLKCEEDEINL